MRECPICEHPTSVVLDSRPETEFVMRIRQCPKCETRWRTHECFVRLVRVENQTALRGEQIRDGSIASNLPHLRSKRG